MRRALCGAAFGAVSASAGVNVNNYNFFMWEEGIRHLGMGGAGYALASGYEGVLVNPAGLSSTAFPQVHFDAGEALNQRLVDVVFAGWGFGAAVGYFSLADSFKDAYPPVAAFGDTGGFIGFGYGRRFASAFAFGAGGRLVTLNFGDKFSAGTGVLDAGATWDATPAWTFGVGVSKLGGVIKWTPDPGNSFDDYPKARYVPSEVVTGAAWKLAAGRVRLAADGHFPLWRNDIHGYGGDPMYLRAGAEYQPWTWFALQGGFRSGLDELKTAVSLGAEFRFGDFDAALAGMPGGQTDTYLTAGDNAVNAPKGAVSVGATYNIGRSRSAGAREGADRERKLFEAQKDAMVGQLLAQVDRFLADGQYGYAVEQLNTILVWDPDNARAKELLAGAETEYRRQQVADKVARARSYLAGGNAIDALREANEALALQPDDAGAASLVAEAEGKLAGEAAAAEAGVASNLATAQALYTRGDYAGAVAAWGKVLAADPGNRAAATNIAAARVRMDEEEAANMEAARTAEAAGRWYEARRYYRSVLAANPGQAEARAGLERAERKQGEEAAALASRAETAFKKGDNDRAEELASEAMDFDAGNARARAVLDGVAAAREKKTPAKAARKDYHAVYLKGIEAYTAHNYAAAIAYWEQIPADDPLYAKAVQNVARARAILKKLEP